MAVEIKLPKEIEIRLRKDKTLQSIITKRLECEIAREIKDDLFDDLLEESELMEEDVENLDRKIKKGNYGEAWMEVVVDTNVIHLCIAPGMD